MSEFQYYEFQAIDRPLDEEAQQALRRISTRALITPHSLVNTYQCGDFKGNPRELVARWFDLLSTGPTGAAAGCSSACHVGP